MTAFIEHPTRLVTQPLTALDIDDVLLSELFASFPRVDQRAKGAAYVRGLLQVEGRKSIRRLAAVSGGAVSEQSLHHFVCSSTWDWEPIRATLARYVARTLPVHAWVGRPLVIPKAGEHSVGVDRGFSPEAGQRINAQHAVGVWAASDEGASPVNWRLHLSRTWLDDEAKRNRAAIPDDVDIETTGSCAVAACLETVSFPGLPVRPVVLDARTMDAASAVLRLRAAGLPLLVRINGSQSLVPGRHLLPGRGTEPSTAQWIMIAARERRRPLYAPRPGGAPAGSGVLAASEAVRLPESGRGAPELVLLGQWERGRGAPAAYWLTTMRTADLASLVRLSQLVDRVDEDFDRITDRMGIRDYSGRSYDGWHRHVTLVSAAHVLSTLNSVAHTELRYAS